MSFILTSGKYKDLSLEEIHQKDKAYLFNSIFLRLKKDHEHYNNIKKEVCNLIKTEISEICSIRIYTYTNRVEGIRESLKEIENTTLETICNLSTLTKRTILQSCERCDTLYFWDTHQRENFFPDYKSNLIMMVSAKLEENERYLKTWQLIYDSEEFLMFQEAKDIIENKISNELSLF